LESKKLAGIRIIPVELEIGRKTAAEASESFQQLVTARLPRNAELPGADHMDFNLVAFSKFKRLHHGGRKTNGQAVSPLGDLHDHSRIGYTWPTRISNSP
jgi:hypothetical protein